MLRRALLAATALFGCTPADQCQFQWVEHCQTGDTSCVATLIDAQHWESNPIEGAWLAFSHNENLHFHLRDGTTGAQLVSTDLQPFAYVSPVQNPLSPGQQFAPCAGNLCEFNYAHDGTTPGWVLDIHNDSCADYYVYVTVTALEPAPADAGIDASDAGGDASDAGGD